MVNPAIIIPAFRRFDSLMRLWDTVEKADYPHREITVCVSIDGGGDNRIREAVEKIRFSHGQVQIVTRDNNIGLKNHLLWCGDLSEKYGSVIILEDDLVVDRYFYRFAQETLEKYGELDDIAGVALYSPRYNELARLPFEPMHNGCSGYFMQSPCSWGQAWTASQWNRFREFYRNVSPTDIESAVDLPRNIREWGEASWKKTFALYMVRTERYFFYPYVSHSTNCAEDHGTNQVKHLDNFQVPMASQGRDFEGNILPEWNDRKVVYDAFMEPISQFLFDQLGVSRNECAIDLYGTKESELLKKKTYALTTRPVRAALRQFPLKFRPIEHNLTIPCIQNQGDRINFAKSSDVDFSNPKKTHVKLAMYYVTMPLFSSKFVSQFFFHYYLKKKRRKMAAWLNAKIGLSRFFG